jgi:predicted DNA-binding transcriptional regulator
MSTRLKALQKQIDSGQIKTDSARVLKYIMEHGNVSRFTIKLALKMNHQTATARVSDLLDMGVIEVVGESRGHEQLIYQKDPMRQVENAYKRKKEKYTGLKKRLLNEFKEFLDLDQLEIKF